VCYSNRHIVNTMKLSGGGREPKAGKRGVSIRPLCVSTNQGGNEGKRGKKEVGKRLSGVGKDGVLGIMGGHRMTITETLDKEKRN